MTKLPLIVAAIGMATTAMVTGTTTTANAGPHLIQANDPDVMAPTRTRNDVEVLRASDEFMTNEQMAFAIDAADPTRGVAVGMSTGRLDGEAGAFAGDTIQVGRMQAACMPFVIEKDDTTETGIRISPDSANFKYITQREADDYRAANHKRIFALEAGYFGVLTNWDRNNNTNTEQYVQIIDSQCNLMQLSAETNVTRRENNTSAMIWARNNDNGCGAQAGQGVSSWVSSPGVVEVSHFCLGNGNGRDDGWNVVWNISAETDGSFTINKKFETSVITREERSRGHCEAMDLDGSGTRDTSVCCGTEGNSQPQREGVWCSGVDLTSGELLWKEQVAYRGEDTEGRRTYAMRIKMLPVKDISGQPTGDLAISYNMHRGNNNMNRKGGYTANLVQAIATPTLDGLGLGPGQDVTDAMINAQIEITHSTMFQTFVGDASNPQPAFSFLAPNHNGAGTVNASVLNLSLDMSNRSFRSVAKSNLASPADGQKYSKYLGNNPNNQGRNYFQCGTIQNPFAGDADGKASGIPVYNICAVTGKLTTAGEPQYQPDFYFEVWNTLTTDPGTEPGGDGDGDGSGNGDGNGDGDGGGGNPNELGGGCSTTGGAGGLASLLLVGLVLGFRRRRN